MPYCASGLLMLLAVVGIQNFEQLSQLAGQKALTAVSIRMVAKTILTTLPCTAVWVQDQRVSNRIAVLANCDAAT